MYTVDTPWENRTKIMKAKTHSKKLAQAVVELKKAQVAKRKASLVLLKLQNSLWNDRQYDISEKKLYNLEKKVRAAREDNAFVMAKLSEKELVVAEIAASLGKEEFLLAVSHNRE